MKAIVLVGIFSIIAFQAVAQQNVEDAQIVRKRYDDCVWGSINEQLRSGSRDLGGVAEIGFQACVTEENAMRLLMSLSGIQPALHEAVILKIKLDIKNRLRKIAQARH